MTTPQMTCDEPLVDIITGCGDAERCKIIFVVCDFLSVIPYLSKIPLRLDAVKVLR
jgi:hypothetical protein